MAKKEFTYRGKTLEELQAMTKDQFVKLLPSRERRTLMRGYNEACKIAESRILTSDRVKTHCREIIITPPMVGKIILVHNGKDFKEVRVNEEMIGHRLGEFSLTRPVVRHSSPGVGATKSSGAVSAR